MASQSDSEYVTRRKSSIVVTPPRKDERHSFGCRRRLVEHRIYGLSNRRTSLSNLEKATRIIDKRGVKKISGLPSGRSIFQVVGESQKREEYLCFPGHYCGCYSFFYDVVSRGEQQCCKHQLAARLASSLGTYSEIEISDEHLALMLSKI